MTFFAYRSFACELICGSRLPGIVSAQSNTSALFWSTDRAFDETFELIFTLMFENPFGMPGIASEAHLGFLTNWNDAFGTTFVIMYGPTPGGGAFGRFFIGVPVGTRPEDGNARTLSNAPYGASRWIVILPVASSAVIPEIVLDLPAAYSLAPTIVPP